MTSYHNFQAWRAQIRAQSAAEYALALSAVRAEVEGGMPLPEIVAQPSAPALEAAQPSANPEAVAVAEDAQPAKRRRRRVKGLKPLQVAFVKKWLASPGVNQAVFCDLEGISPRTFRDWLAEYQAGQAKS